jgi:hypothetical protein
MVMTQLPTLTRMRELQAQHDTLHHRDVANLPDREKLRHYVFHLVKYAAGLTPIGLSEKPIQKTLADTMIIALAMANVLERYDLEAFVQKVAPKSEEVREVTSEQLKDQILYQVGKMSKLSEGHDHMENLNYRSEYAEANASIIAAVMSYTDYHGVNLLRLIQNRWNFIRENKVA